MHLELSAQVANHLPLSRLNLTSGRLLRISLQQSESAHSLSTRSTIRGFASAIRMSHCKIRPSHLSRADASGSSRPSWGFRHHAENGLIKMVVDWPLVILTKSETLFQTRPDHQTKKEGLLVQPVFCKVATGSCCFYATAYAPLSFLAPQVL